MYKVYKVCKKVFKKCIKMHKNVILDTLFEYTGPHNIQMSSKMSSLDDILDDMDDIMSSTSSMSSKMSSKNVSLDTLCHTILVSDTIFHVLIYLFWFTKISEVYKSV